MNAERIAKFLPIPLTHTPKSFQIMWPYVQIARVDHWFKNIFMILGIILAVFYDPNLLNGDSVVTIAIAVFATCLVASSNYVINELLDAPYDCMHPASSFWKNQTSMGFD